MVEDTATTKKAPMTGTTKADFTSIYDQPDPRAYYRTLVPLDYQIPQTALPVLDRVIDASADNGAPRPALDVCSSYGINGALLRNDVALDDLAANYMSLGDDLSPEQVAASDRALLDGRARAVPRVVYGLDAAPNAIAYAKSAGLVDDGWAVDLENDAAPQSLRDALAGVRLIVCTGGVGYVTARTFDALAGLVADPADLWLAVFVLRVFDYSEIAEVLSERGLVTEQLEGQTFRQRRFADEAEQDAAVTDVIDRGLDPAGKEADGWFHADCFITRPAAAAASTPLESLFS